MPEAGQLADFAAADKTIKNFVATYNAHQGHPITWNKGVKFYQRLNDKLTAAASPASVQYGHL